MEMLVQGLHSQEVCWGCARGNRAPLMPEKCWSVIHGGVHCSFADIVVVSDDVMLHERCCHFKVGIGGAPTRILKGDRVIDNVWGKMASTNRVAHGSGACFGRCRGGSSMPPMPIPAASIVP
jgi:hypothetical protein